MDDSNMLSFVVEEMVIEGSRRLKQANDIVDKFREAYSIETPIPVEYTNEVESMAFAVLEDIRTKRQFTSIIMNPLFALNMPLETYPAILAHEVAHYLQGVRQGNYQIESNHESEYEADELATKILKRAGYAPELMVFALKSTGRFYPLNTTTKRHPSINDRIARLNNLLKEK